VRPSVSKPGTSARAPGSARTPAPSARASASSTPR
jgi:hypothetical protein